MLEIDGAMGEGGGQVLRTSLALSLVTQTPIHIRNIRAGRGKPGLLRQHLAAVRAAVAVGQGEAVGAELGARELLFTPGPVRRGHHTVSIGGAGSTTLVLQTVLPALITGAERSVLVLEGGTHNPLAPPFEFLARTFAPVLARMGPTLTLTLERHGFAPGGGGRMVAQVTPVERLRPTELVTRGGASAVRATVLAAHVPAHVADREASVLRRGLHLPPDACSIRTLSEVAGPGNVLMVDVDGPQGTVVFTAHGERGHRAEAVATGLVEHVRQFLATDVPVDEYLADQLLLPMALARGGAFRTGPLSLHARTQVDLIPMFLPVRFAVDADAQDTVQVRVET